MKHIFTTFALVCVSAAVMAIPAWREPQVMHTTNGDTISLILQGDEVHHFWTTLDGKLAVRNNDGTFSITDQKPNAETIRAARMASPRAKHLSQQPKRKADLPSRGLVILCNFSDLTFNAANSAAAMDSLMNGRQYHDDGATGSTWQYFHDQSNGAYNPVYDVVGPVTLPHGYAYYGENDHYDNDHYVADFVMDACIQADAAGVDFSLYDNNNDGMVDFVYLIYAGYSEAETYDYYLLWPSNWDLKSALHGDYTRQSTYFYASESHCNLLTLDGKVINEYAFSAELNSSGSRTGIGAICHEYSHVLGLMDMYDTNYGNNYHSTPFTWNLMDYGSYLNRSKTPPNYSAWDKYYLGWATPTLLHEACDDTLPADGQTYRYISSDGRPRSATSIDTVYYLENRQKTGWDAYVPASGMLVWKVVYNRNIWNANEVNAGLNGRSTLAMNTFGTLHYMLVSANGAVGTGNASDPFPGSGNVTSFTPFADYPITDITHADGKINYKFMGGAPEPKEQSCDNYAYDFAAAMQVGEQTLGDYTWTLSMSNASSLDYDVTQGAKLGSGTNPAGLAQLVTSDATTCTIDSVVINASMDTNGDATLSVYVGDIQIGSTATLTDTPADYVFKNTEDLQGTFEIRFVNTTEAEYIKSIRIVYKVQSSRWPTEVANPAAEQPRARKVLRNGQIVICVGDAEYDILGLLIR